MGSDGTESLLPTSTVGLTSGLSTMPLLDDDAALQRAVRKSGWQVLPSLCLMIIFNYFDRTNLAFSYIKPSFKEKVGLTATAYGAGSGLFYLSYVICQPFMAFYLGKLKRPQALLGSMNIAWGGFSILFAFISSPLHFYALRMLLGTAESICFPAAWYLASCFIPNSHLTVAMGIVMLSIPVSMAIAAPLAVAIFQLDGAWGLHDWQWLFLTEGIPPIFVGLYIIFVFPAKPAGLRGLQDEHTVLLANLPQHANTIGDDDKPSNWSVVKALLCNWRLIYLSILVGIGQFAFAGMFYFLPIIVLSVVSDQDTHDKSKFDNLALLLTSGIYVLCGCSLLIVSKLAQTFRSSRWFLAGLLLASGIFFGAMVFMDQLSPKVQLILLLLGMMPQYSVMGIAMAYIMAYSEGITAAAGPGLFNAINNTFAIFGPIVMGVLHDKTGSYSAAFLNIGFLVVVSGVMSVFLPKARYELEHKQDAPFVAH